MNAICLVIDRLNVGHVGAYGNTWINTPAIDALASQAVALDQMLVDSPRLVGLYRSYWEGWHGLCPTDPPQDRPSLPRLLRQAGVHTALLTDEPVVARHPLAAEFDELLEVDQAWETPAAAEIEQTHMARCIVQAIDWLESAERPFLLWCHLAGLGTTWDAPAELCEVHREPGDPELPVVSGVPNQMLPVDHDPDLLLGITQVYAGQVSVLDACLGALVDYVNGSPHGAETLLTLTAARGFPLGEHRRVGLCDEALHGELLHVPLLVRLPDRRGATARSQALVEPADLWATLLDWWNVADVPRSPTAASLLPLVRLQTEPFRDRLCIAGRHGERAIRTPAWYLRVGSEPELYAKPDDRWEVNNVAARCQEVVECLQDALSQYCQTLQSGQIADLPPLSEVLRSGLE